MFEFNHDAWVIGILYSALCFIEGITVSGAKAPETCARMGCWRIMRLRLCEGQACAFVIRCHLHTAARQALAAAPSSCFQRCCDKRGLRVALGDSELVSPSRLSLLAIGVFPLFISHFVPRLGLLLGTIASHPRAYSCSLDPKKRRRRVWSLCCSCMVFRARKRINKCRKGRKVSVRCIMWPFRVFLFHFPLIFFSLLRSAIRGMLLCDACLQHIHLPRLGSLIIII